MGFSPAGRGKAVELARKGGIINTFMHMMGPVTANDIIRCLVESKRRYGNKKVVVMGTRNIIYQADNFFEIMGLEIETILMPSQMGGETEKAFAKLNHRECVVVGGKPTCDYARSIGMDRSWG